MAIGFGPEYAVAMTLGALTSHLDELLADPGIEEYKNALNGLQVENSGKVRRIFAAVDACEWVIREAAAHKSCLLIVHHGLFWNGLQPLTGPAFRKMRLALAGDLAIYSSHLPLDAHALFGNNALLANKLNLDGPRERFLKVGWRVEDVVPRKALVSRVEAAVGGRVHVAPGGPVRCRRIGVVSGGAGGEIFQAAAEGVDTFITGEGPHWTYTAAEELGINLIYAGHYGTETFGVKALAEHLGSVFGVPWEFLDHPTGL